MILGITADLTEPDRRSILLNAYENAAVIVSGISDDQLDHPTPCPRYDVAALIDHIVEAGRRAAALGRGQPPAPGDASPHTEVSEAAGRLRSAARAATAAWGDDPGLATTVAMPWGEHYTGAALVDMYVVELAAHAWDLAEATGQVDGLDPTLAEPALRSARAFIRPAYRDRVGPGAPFGAEVPVPLDADDWERFAAFTGRYPRPSIAPASQAAEHPREPRASGQPPPSSRCSPTAPKSRAGAGAVTTGIPTTCPEKPWTNGGVPSRRVD